MLFFCSGAAALLFETLWFRQAGLALGNTVWASSTVLSAFMAGLALGNLLAARLAPRLSRGLRVYATLELAIALSGPLIVFVIPLLGGALAPLFEALSRHAWLLNSARLLIAFACLALPAVAMGATLPVLTRVLFERDPRFGTALGRLYGWNTLGAVAGALLGELALIEWLGVPGTAACAACLALLAAGGASALARQLEQDPATPPPAPPPPGARIPRRIYRPLAAAALAGAAMLALEVLWFRFLVLFFPPTPWAFSVMLAVVLAGIALGGLLGGRLLSRWPQVSAGAGPLCWLACALAVAGYGSFDPRGSLAEAAFRWGGPTATVPALALELMFPVSLASGVLFTLLGARIHAALADEDPASATRASGWLTVSNTAGGVVGSAMAGFVLLPVLGLERSLWLIAGVYALIGLLLTGPWLREGTRGRAVGGLAGALALVALLGFPRGAFEQRFLAISGERYLEGRRVVDSRESIYGMLRMAQRDFLDRPLDHRLLHDGYSITGTATFGRRYMKLFAYLPLAMHPQPRDALVIAFGVGQTTKALADTPWLESIHLADPSQAVLDMRASVFPDPAQDPLLDDRLRVHLEDGRFYLQTSGQRFDVITGEPPPPKLAGIGALYSREFFQLIHDRLNEGGLASYWLPCHLLTADDALAIVAAWLEVFPDATLWQGSREDLLLIGGRRAEGRIAAETWTRQWATPHVRAELVNLGFERPEQLAALFLADAAQLAALVEGVAPVTDDHPYRLSSATPGDYWEVLGSWVEPRAALRRYQTSDWVAQRLPPLDAARAEELYGVQATLERLLRAGFGIDVPLPLLDAGVRQTELETLVLWLGGSSADEQRIAHQAWDAGERAPLIDYHLALGALARRDYAEAAARMTACAEALPQEDSLRLQQAYALCLAGRTDDARALLPGRAHGDWAWLGEAFGLR
jgi:predicted membrane-bound spermidine synthase